MKDLDNLLEHSTKGINDAVMALDRLQKKISKPIITSYDFLNDLCFGGLQKDMVITFAARPSGGKTYLAQVLRKDILKNDNTCLLYYNWEMSWFNLLILEIKKSLKIPLNEILNRPPTPEELEQYKKIASEYRDDRFTSVERALTPVEFEYVTRKYIETNIDKEHIVVMIDHIGITKGSNKMESIYAVVEVCNKLKLEFPNKITFIILSQLNREIEKLWRTRDTNPINLRVTSEYIFAADAVVQGSDLVIGMVIPSRAGLDKYCAINREHNLHLAEHIVDEDKEGIKDYVRLKGLNRIYYDIVKKRLDDDSPRLYCQILDPEQEVFNQAVNKYERDYTDDNEIIF